MQHILVSYMRQKKKKNSETVERLETAETERLELIKLREEMYRMTEAAPESVANTSMEEKEKVLTYYYKI